MITSAYMIAHCDDDFMEAAIDSVIDRVDEFIFVDGAYAWVAPFFEKSGIDPSRSWPRTHEILAKYGDKVKYFSGIWSDELEKRAFGFAQCRGEIIIRIDADEIFEFDEVAYTAFLDSNKIVAGMEFPYLLGPKMQRLEASLAETPIQCCVFRADRFRAPADHCAYLWLVLTGEERSRCAQANWQRMFQTPVIHTAHLTAFRTPRTSVNRARFYTLQHIRSTGRLGWSYNQTPVENPEDRIAQIFNFMSPSEHASYLEGQEIVSGFVHMNGFTVAPYTFGEAVTLQIDAACKEHEKARAELLDFVERPRVVVSGVPSLIDITSLVHQGTGQFVLEFSDPVNAFSGHINVLLDTPGDQTSKTTRPVVCTVEGRYVRCSFDFVDVGHVLMAVFVMLPKSVASSKKTLLIGLKAG